MAPGSGSASQPVSDVTVYPYSTTGKLLYRQHNESWYGTAFIVGARGILTAAHNLWDAGEASTSIEFYPQYTGGHSLGVWQPELNQIHIPPDWEQPCATTTFDFATFRTTEPLPIDRTGALSYLPSAGVAQGRQCLTIGYPGGSFDAEKMWQCTGSIDYCLWFLSQMQSNFTAGAGGGPWLVQEDTRWYVIGTTGRTYGEVVTSPPFDATVQHYVDMVTS
jgi:V8-like Glu-specific endopeptidase